MNLFGREIKNIEIAKVLNDPRLDPIQKFSKTIVLLQGDISNSEFATSLELTHSTIGRWREGAIKELTCDILIKISPLTEYSPGELLEMLYGLKPNVRKVRTSNELLALSDKLPESEQVEVCNQIVKRLPKTLKLFHLQTTAQLIADD